MKEEKTKKKFELLLIYILNILTNKILYVTYLLSIAIFTTIIIKIISFQLKINPELIINFIGIALIAETFAKWREGIKFLLSKFLYSFILIIFYIFSINHTNIGDLSFSVIFLTVSLFLYYIGTKILNHAFEDYLLETLIKKDSIQNIIKENSSYQAIEKINNQINPIYKDFVRLTSLDKESSTNIYYINDNKLLTDNYNYNLTFSIFLYKRIEDFKMKLININILDLNQKFIQDEKVD